MTDTTTVTSAKKPGRPRKKIANKSDTLAHGLIDTPNNDEHIMELIYNEPKVFKKIFSMFKGYYVDDIFINFKKDQIYIISKDHTKKTIIKIVIDCNKVTEYYCKMPFEICIKREYLEKIFSTIEKNHSKIVLFSTESSYQSTIEINLINDDASIHDSYIIDLSLQQKNIDKDLIDCVNYNKDDYSINFSVKSKSFKKFINDTSINGKLLTIEKIGDNNMKFKMCFNNKIVFTRTIINEDSYNLNSNLSEDDFFNINLELEYIKPFSNMNISDFVYIYIDGNKKAIFENVISDGMCVISIYNEIINYVTTK
jgi:hypothetical protein|tara:strand:+ start:365 stop:1297 length:933 start_codon:yes stop_codon:yes gene_type:complete